MTSLKVYLCDLTYDTVKLVSDTIPVNIGYIGSYAKKMHGNSKECGHQSQFCLKNIF